MPNAVPVSVPISSIPRSSSEPDTSKNKHSDIPSSNRSTHSSKSSGFWKKGGKLIARRSANLENSNLTEEILEEFNRKNAAADKKNLNCSPYYKGLTDSTLYISRLQKHVGGGCSPERESHGTAVTSSTISTVFSTIHKWSSSCFTSKEDSNATRASSSMATTMRLIVDDKEVSLHDTKSSSFDEKPLRERNSAAETAAPVPPVMIKKKVIVVEEKPKEASTHKESEFVWANKYRPDALEDFICNRDKAAQLHTLVKNNEQCSHYIFEGPPGVGKRTMIWALLRESFGSDRLQTRDECKEFELKGEAIASIQVNVKVSSQHLEINLSELRGYEKHVIVSLIKDTQSTESSHANECDNPNYRAIILYEADKLSTDAQLYTRWLLERYKGCNRIFFCCSDVSKLHPIRSLCRVVQLFPPSNKEIVEVLEFIAKREGIELPHQLAEKIAEKSQHNLRQAIRSFEASWRSNYPFREDQVLMTGWEEDISNIAKNIIEEQSPKQLYVIRGKLQNLIEHNVSPYYIFYTLVGELKNQVDEQYHAKIDALYQDYIRESGGIPDNEKSLGAMHRRNEESDKRNNDPAKRNVHNFMKIEELIAKFMSFYKNNVVKNIEEPKE